MDKTNGNSKKEKIMKRFRSIITAMTFSYLFLFSLQAQSGQGWESDKTLSPYFFVTSEESALDQLPLKHTAADVRIAGIIADVKMTQIYNNQGQSVLEAIYIFPASTRAAVYAMKMTIGERIIEAKIDKRETARQTYEQAIEEGRTASLLEQQRPNVFQMNVGNILPGDEIVVELSYTEMLISQKNLYEFVYPTVVGPRYSNQNESGAGDRDRWIQNPYLQEGEQMSSTFALDLTLSAGMPINEILSPTHDVEITYQSEEQAQISLKGGAGAQGNRDFILRYRLAQERIKSGLLLQRGDKENFFLLMLQPPDRIKIDQIPGREYIFIVDVSGSMNGFPLDISKQLLRDLIGNLRSSDLFNVILFAAGSSLLAPSSLPATRANIEKAIRMIDDENGGGGTELLPALKRALGLKRHENYSRSVIIATDGYVSVEKEAFELIRKNLDKANIFSFGIGSGVNRFLIEGMARAGMGESFVITEDSEAAKTAAKFREYISSPVLTDISYTIDGFDAYSIEPAAIPDILSGRPVILFGKWRGKPAGKFHFTGTTGNNQTYSVKIDVSDSQVLENQRALKYLWARQRLVMLSDDNQLSTDERLQESITRLGLDYNLLTEYTSFVAVDSKIRSSWEKVITVRQPLPLPQGVSNLAVAGAGSGVRSLGYQKNARPSLAPGLNQADAREFESIEEKKQEIVSLAAVFAARNDLADEVCEQFESVRDKLEECFQKTITDGRFGTIRIELSLDVSGRVKSLSVVQNDFEKKDLVECITAVIKQWIFKSAGISENTKLKFSLSLGS
jgi:Ca-activated chloride channel family protein